VGQAEVIEVGEVVVDHRVRQVLVRGVPVRLSGREFDVVARLASEPDRVVTKADLLRDVWGIRFHTRTRTVDSHACRARRKLEAAGAPGMVENVWGVGYCLRSGPTPPDR
jgi:DNA-binding response OmpR family regulator